MSNPRKVSCLYNQAKSNTYLELAKALGASVETACPEDEKMAFSIFACEFIEFGFLQAESLQVDNTVFVDAEFGDDATGIRQNQALRFRTISAAIAASSPGDKIFATPGTYDENNLTIPHPLTLDLPGVVINDTANPAHAGNALVHADTGNILRVLGRPSLLARNGPALRISGTGTIIGEFGSIRSLGDSHPAIDLVEGSIDIDANSISSNGSIAGVSVIDIAAVFAGSEIKAGEIFRTTSATGSVVRMLASSAVNRSLLIQTPCITNNDGSCVQVDAGANVRLKIENCEFVTESSVQCINLDTVVADSTLLFLNDCVLITEGTESIESASSDGHQISLIGDNVAWVDATGNPNIVLGALNVSNAIPSFCNPNITPPSGS